MKNFKYFDEFIIKPLLIYDYENRYEEINSEKHRGQGIFKNVHDSETNYLNSHYYEQKILNVQTKFNKKSNNYLNKQSNSNQQTDLNNQPKANSTKNNGVDIFVTKAYSDEKTMEKKYLFLNPEINTKILKNDSTNKEFQGDRDITL